MEVEIDLTKSIQENADSYYGLAKKSKKKLGGLAKGMEEIEKKIASSSVEVKTKTLVQKRAKEWYEKFHWFFTSENFLVISGRDAKTNEIVVKKHMAKSDVYFHADVHGAPHTVLVTAGKKPSQISLNEAAIFAAVFSKAWSEQLSAVDVYSAAPEQVTKTAPSGESLGTGAFMVYGKRTWHKKTPLTHYIGLKKNGDSLSICSGSESAVRKNSDFMLKLSFGSDSKGLAAKKIRVKFSEKLKEKADLNLDDIMALLPSGGLAVNG